MTGHHSFQVLRDRMDADPKRRSGVEEIKRAYDALLALAELRQSGGRTRKHAADGVGVAQANGTQLEPDYDLCLSTLGKYVAVLGGRLELTAVFPERRIRLGVPVAPGPEEVNPAK